MDKFFSIDLSQLSILNFFWILFLGIITFFAINFFKNRVIGLIVKSPVKRKRLKVRIPAFEALLWILYGLYTVYILILPFPFFGVILFLLALYLVRKSAVNLVQGVVFRLKDSLEEGQKVIVKNEEGHINSINTFGVSFENKEGEIKLIPYEEFVNLNVVKKDFSSEFFSHKFSIKTKDNIGAEDIKNQIVGLPWSSEVFLPKVTKTKLDEGVNQFDIIIYAIDRRYFSFIEEDIRKLNNII